MGAARCCWACSRCCAGAVAEGVRAVGSRAELAAILAPDGPLALVDFHAIWCGPCRAMAPAFAATAEACADLPVAFHSVDIDEHPDLAEAFGVRGVPTILVIQGGGGGGDALRRPERPRAAPAGRRAARPAQAGPPPGPAPSVVRGEPPMPDRTPPEGARGMPWAMRRRGPMLGAR